MPDRPFIVLLSHMRSYSSVLSHILGSHPDICGYSELHCETLTQQGMQAAKKILEQREDYSQAQFLFDKLLHNSPVHRDLIEDRQIFPLICVREPKDTIQSIINMGELYCRDERRKRTLKNCGLVTEYYIGRLRWLEHFVSRFRENCFFFRSEQLMSDGPSLLNRIQEHLQLTAPLQTSYQLFEFTGSAGHGDPSPRIRLGRLDDRENCYDSIPIPTPLLDVARRTYHALLAGANAED